MATQQQVQMTAKLYECRDAARRLLGDHYKRDVDAWGTMIRHDAERKGCSHLAAATSIANEKPDGFRSVVILAAFVEMTEPSE